MPTEKQGLVSLEEKIIRVDADAAIRRRMFLAGQYSPTEAQVGKLINRAFSRLKDKYSDLSTMWRDVSGESLTPLVNAEVDGLKI